MKNNKLIFKLLQNLKINEKCIFHVSSNSMWPLINIDDQIILQKTDIKNIKKFNIIIFYSNELKELLVHRVIDIDKNKGISLETRGDNNSHKDNIYIDKKNFLGRVVNIKNKKIDLNKNNYSWLRFYISSQIFLKMKKELFYFFYNS